MALLRQIRALMWKDLRLCLANRVATIIEIVFPLLIACFVGLFMLLMKILVANGNEYSDTHPNKPFVKPLTWTGAVASTVSGDDLVNRIYDRVKLNSMGTIQTTVPDVRAKFYTDSSDYMFQLFYNKTIHGSNAIDFLGLEDGGNGTLTVSSGRTDADSKRNDLIHLGRIIASALGAESVSSDTSHAGLYLTANLRAIFSNIGMIFLIYAFIPATIITGGRLVEDKQCRMRESLKVMGCSDGAYLISNFFSSILRMAIGTALISFVLAPFGAIDAADIPKVFGILLAFAMTMIAFAQIMPSLFSAGIWANVATIVFLAGSAALSSFSTGWGAGAGYACCIFSPVAFYYGMIPSIAMNSVTLKVSPGGAMIMLLVDLILYILIGNYIYAINPGDFGVPHHPLFFIRWIWTKKDPNEGGGKLADEEKPLRVNSHEPGCDSNSRVVLKGLMKYYGSQRDKPSVNNLSLDIKKKEIYALLGHNGAGKTTTMSVLTGMITPTSYEIAQINGHDIRTEMDEIRKSIGLCPQFDVLFNDLSAREHFYLFAAINGIENPDARVEELLDALKLPKDKQRSSTFSGGMKRRLSVGNALIGGANLIFLDEPSSGMDPVSRRQMWDLLKREKEEGKTIVLTTHFMEEADYLGDRIAIMSHGKMFTCATSTQLKQKYSLGYTLTIAKESNDACNVEGILRLLRQHSPDAKIIHDGSGDVSFTLPSADLPKFGALFEEFEANMRGLGAHSYGVNMSTLEDVFVEIAKKEERDGREDHQDALEQARALDTSTANGEDVELIFARGQQVPFMSRTLSQIGTVLRRKLKLLSRSRRMQLMIIFFPLFFISIAFLTIMPKPKTKPSMTDFEKLSEVKPEEFNLVFCDYRDRSETAVFRETFSTLFAQALPGYKLTFYIAKDYSSFATGQYVPLKSLSWTEQDASPPVLGGFGAHHTNILNRKDGAYSTNYTVYWNPKYDPAYSTIISSLMYQTFQVMAKQPMKSIVFTKPGNLLQIDQDVVINDFVPMWRANPVINAFMNGNSKLEVERRNDFGKIVSPPPQTKKYNIMQVGMYIVLSMGQLVANTAIPISEELTLLTYNTNLAQGMSPVAYFIGNLIFDLACATYPILLFTLGVVIRGVESYLTSVLPIIIIAGIFYGVHVILQSYIIVSYLPGRSTVIYTVMMHSFNLGTLAGPYIVKQILDALKFKYLDDINIYLLSVFPTTAWYHMIDEVSDMNKEESNASTLMKVTGNRPTGISFIFLLCELVIPIFVVYCFAANNGVYKWWLRRLEQKQSKAARKKELERVEAEGQNASFTQGGSNIAVASGENNGSAESMRQISNGSIAGRMEDGDVADERRRVEANPDDNMIALTHLRRRFGDKIAVQDLSVGIQAGQCFGLLGPNGAGKSTTCKLILRQMEPTKGEIAFPYCGVKNNTPDMEAFQKMRLGICMQVNTLWGFLTAEEHMDQMLRLRLTTEYKPEQWKTYIQNTIQKVQLQEAGPDRRAEMYSGGMKRKLMVAMAMYTGAQTVFLDEPSTGMDPFARRALWSIILEALQGNRAVILTTHSMEEAEAVCNRIAIIATGALKCIGSPQHLKDKFGSGYVVTIGFKPDATQEHVNKLRNDLQQQFQNLQLSEELGLIHRYTADSVGSLSAAFKYLEANKEQWAAEQYSVSQTASLEQIFLTFVGTKTDD